ncbi:unnamed protein product (macronuclear) [Paramecium tetraurelia]|uniref:Uncharacterized protein n=1 Tax=Paramecium tetraurelia TaxID=5888 RepID=A0BDF9_PARTE|nr:uncharacterized protein GSPATT00027604001 [Paramecium tetraurelia]CAK56576.1 unnamed protein product [Paramecium tetraurelia]|eukprot:XP_001423974.1 hypothetical protein (macronuclear) [Paramecium tetraurelia strain d4-2]
MKQVILAILFFGLCINAQVERHTLQGALNLLEQAQNDVSIYDQQEPRLYTWFCSLRDGFARLFQPITENKLASHYAFFGSVPAVIFMAGFMPMILLVVFSYGMFKFITYEPKKMEFKYSKLPIKDVPKPQNNKLQFPAFGLFSFI